jgi:hypothetical protein
MMLLHKQPDEMARAALCYRELTDAFCDQGYLPYRTNVAFMEHTMSRLDPVFREVCLQIKAALDPNGIIAPGKNGIRLDGTAWRGGLGRRDDTRAGPTRRGGLGHRNGARAGPARRGGTGRKRGARSHSARRDLPARGT